MISAVKEFNNPLQKIYLLFTKKPTKGGSSKKKSASKAKKAKKKR